MLLAQFDATETKANEESMRQTLSIPTTNRFAWSALFHVFRFEILHDRQYCDPNLQDLYAQHISRVFNLHTDIHRPYYIHKGHATLTQESCDKVHDTTPDHSSPM